MTTSTPPAWAWLEEKYVPVHAPSATAYREYCQMREEALSIHSRKLPDSDALRERNDSCDPTGEDVWPLERARVQSVRETPTKLRVGARNEHPAWVCACCGQDRWGRLFDASTWHSGKCDICGMETAVTEPRDFGNRHDDDPTCTVTADETTSPADSCRVPFKTQEWMFESLAECELVHLHDILDDHHDLILEMARDRFRRGYAKYGSAAHLWDAETRMTNVLEELADAVVYLTTGSVE